MTSTASHPISFSSQQVKQWMLEKLTNPVNTPRPSDNILEMVFGAILKLASLNSLQVFEGDTSLNYRRAKLPRSYARDFRRSGADGVSWHAIQSIALRQGLSPYQRLHTLTHELSHQLLGHSISDNRSEAQAELTAFYLLQVSGLDNPACVAGYLDTICSLPQAIEDFQEIFPLAQGYAQQLHKLLITD
jgi:hypothetical protein